MLTETWQNIGIGSWIACAVIGVILFIVGYIDKKNKMKNCTGECSIKTNSYTIAGYVFLGLFILPFVLLYLTSTPTIGVMTY